MPCLSGLRLFVAALALTFALSAAPALADPQFRSGVGLTSCEKLAKDLSADQGLDNMPNALLYYWLQGYMSAANIHLLDDNNQFVDVGELDAKKITAALANFCKSNPDKRPVDAIDSLIKKSEKISTDQWKSGTVEWSE